MIRPLIGIPAGDPAGIGPEIVMKALESPELYTKSRPVVAGCKEVFEQIGKILGSKLKINLIQDPSQGFFELGTIDLIECGTMDTEKLSYGKVQAEAGKAAYECIKKVTELALEKKLDAIATTPINKEAIRAANLDFIGHTEALADLTGSHDPLTMFQVRNMRVFFLTRHLSLIEACKMVSKERLCDYIQRCMEAMEMLGVKDGLMAVAGLNPHNGENGLFGDEECNFIEPAVKEMKARGFNVCGPIPGDSVFAQALAGRFDAVLSLYHDQGHIATKTVDFERTISLTIGLPFLRTSVDHGTAFDIAGKGVASGVSMEEAIRLAAEYAPYYMNK